MSTVSNWMWVDIFTVQQAAALWCNFDPAKLHSFVEKKPSEFDATVQMLVSGMKSGELHVDSSDNAFRRIGDFNKSYVARAELEAFARKRNLFPSFLFDTLAPFGAQNSALALARSSAKEAVASPGSTASKAPSPVHVSNRGGRPTEYDWDSFTMEIIHRANQPDGLPEVQAHLTGEMLLWFQEKLGSEPAISSVKDRISKIYKYIAGAKNHTL